jgi:hypothetical protein
MCQFDLAFVRNVLLDLSQYIPDCAFKMDPLATLIEVIVPCRDDGAKYLGQQRNQSKATEPDRCTASANSAYFVVLDDTKPPSRIELGREPLLVCGLYLGLMQTLNDGHVLSAQNTVITQPAEPLRLTTSFARSPVRPCG